ncbi:NAD-dependent epimerase/dehydratase family protein [Nitrosospira multiformis]|uniref:Dihydroflavonol-4-reductase n=1 Tax=Nitrosospira multiformis TaxID=1231 RepID=A0A1I7IRA8_9PROT|nr:NAD-dependent epimerase/dehydratase family protein [Nitrosospira multiformis]SFU75448.1 dihydroflavonol-4-reductase [Nitrosospira multiformis]
MNLVTGGAGFIGSHLVQQLLTTGEPVRVLEHPTAVVSHLPLECIELIQADIRDLGAMRKAARGCERVYHLAADPNLWRRNRSEFDEINHVGTLNVMRAALDSGVSRALYVSTESILTSDHSKGGAVEYARFREEDMIGPYCLSKFRAEQAVFQLAVTGAPVIVCSPTLPIGPGDRNQTPPTRLSVAFCRGKIPAYLDCQLNLIDVRDLADGLIRAMQRGRPFVRYLLGGYNYRLIEWLQLLGDIVNRPAPRWTIPYSAALAVGWFSELWSDHISHRMPVATVTGVRLTKRLMHFDPSQTFEELGLKPRPIEESARDAVSWYRQQHWI